MRKHTTSMWICRLTVGLAVFVVIMSCGGGALAEGHSSARSVGMGGAHIGLATGVEAARYNPANLGLEEHRQSSLTLVGAGISVHNNSLTLDDYNNYTGKVLSDADKSDILGKIPSEGLHLRATAEASALAFSTGSLVLSATGIGAADINLSKDILDLALNGNAMGQEMAFTDSYSDAVAYIEGAVSYGMPLYRIGERQLAVGATVKYLKGLAIERVIRVEGGFRTLATGLEGDGTIVAQTATGGSGYGLDLGAALRLSPSYTVGLSVRNLVSKINWNQDTEEHGYHFSFDTMTVDNMDADYIVSDDYSNDISGFSTTLPSVMTVGIAKTTGRLLWAVDWVQGFRRDAGSSSKPRLCLGVEWTGLRLLPLRGGLATGGADGTGFSVGSGLHLGAFHLDFAAVTGSSISPYSTRGVNVAVSTGFMF